MAYCTSTELEAALSAMAQSQLSADTGTTPDSTILTEIIANASARIDFYLSGRYSVPITTGASTLAYLKATCISIAAYLLLKRRLISGEHEDFRNDYIEAIDELKDIRSGVLELPGTTSTEGATDPRLDDRSVVGSELQIYGIIVDNNRRASTYF